MTAAVILGTLVIVLIVVAIGVKVERKVTVLADGNVSMRITRPPPIETHGLGEAPISAFKVGDTQLARVRSNQRCPDCRAEMTYLGDADDHVRYDERELLVLHFACPSCPAKRTLYVEPTTSITRS